MTLYTKAGRTFRPATEPEILSAYGALMAARRKSNAGGRSAKLRESAVASIRLRWRSFRDDQWSGYPPRKGKAEFLADLAEYHKVSTRTIRRIIADA